MASDTALMFFRFKLRSDMSRIWSFEQAVMQFIKFGVALLMLLLSLILRQVRVSLHSTKESSKGARPRFAPFCVTSTVTKVFYLLKACARAVRPASSSLLLVPLKVVSLISSFLRSASAIISPPLGLRPQSDTFKCLK